MTVAVVVVVVVVVSCETRTHIFEKIFKSSS
jgi:hypothetical protein